MAAYAVPVAVALLVLFSSLAACAVPEARCTLVLQRHGHSNKLGVRYATLNCSSQSAEPLDIQVNTTQLAQHAGSFQGVNIVERSAASCQGWLSSGTKPYYPLIQFCGGYLVHLEPVVRNVRLRCPSDTVHCAILGFGGNSRATINNGLLQDNQAGFAVLASDGAHVTIKHSTVQGNVGPSAARAMGNATMHIANSSFITCTSDTNSEGIGGGALSAAGSATVNVNGSVFSGNIGNLYGGAVYLGDAARMNISHSQFVNNSSPNAGAVIVQNDAAVSIEHSVLATNLARVWGGALGASHTAAVRVSSSLLVNNTAADYGGAVILAHRAYLAVHSSSIMNGRAGFSGGAITAWHSSTVSIASSRIVGCTAELGGGIYGRDNSVTEITNSSFTGCTGVGGGVHVRSNASMTVTSSLIAYNSGASGAGACAKTISRLLFVGSRITGNIASEVGDGLVVDEEARVIVGSSVIDSNIALNGAGVYAHDSAALSLSGSSRVVNNSARSAGGGLSFVENASLHISPGCLVATNAAGQFAGGLWIAYDQFSLANVTQAVQGNHAAYNADLGVAPTQLAIMGNSVVKDFVSQAGSDKGLLFVSLNVSGRFGLPCGGLMVQAVLQAVHNGSQDPQDSQDFQPDAQAFDALGVSYTGSDGTALFGLKLQGPPGLYRLRFSMTGSAHVAPAHMLLEVRNCRVGEVTPSPESCQECMQGWYSLSPTDTVCTPCMRGAVCPGGSVILPQPGFWSPHISSPQVHRCPNQLACRGLSPSNLEGTSSDTLAFQHPSRGSCNDSLDCSTSSAADNQTNPSSKGPSSSPARLDVNQCSLGYTGNLCGVCDAGYAKVKPFTCRKCLPAAVVIALCAVAMIFMLLIIKVLVYFTLKENSQLSIRTTQSASSGIPPAELLRPLLLYVQMLLIIASMNVQWPVTMSYMLHALSVVWAPAAAESLGAECIFPASSSIPSAVQVVLFQLCMPVVLLLVSLLVEVDCMKLFRRNSTATLSMGARLACTAMVVAQFFLPAVARVAFSMFACVNFDSEMNAARAVAPVGSAAVGKFWLMDMQQLCFQGYHRTWALSLGVPVTLLVCVGLPVTILLVTLCNRKRLNHLRVSQFYGTLYRSYKPARCYWEAVSVLQLLALVAISVFGFTLGSYYQTLVMTAALSLVGLLLLICQPHAAQPAAGHVALQSVGCLLLISFAALCFVAPPADGSCSGPAPSDGVYSVVVGAVVVAVNAAFVASVMWRLGRLIDWANVKVVLCRVAKLIAKWGLHIKGSGPRSSGTCTDCCMSSSSSSSGERQMPPQENV